MLREYFYEKAVWIGRGNIRQAIDQDTEWVREKDASLVPGLYNQERKALWLCSALFIKRDAYKRLEHFCTRMVGIGSLKTSISLSGREKAKLVPESSQRVRFEQLILPHLDAAYNLARWLTHNDQDAQDVVQEAYLRAFKFFQSFRGGDSRSWILTIVRNTCYTWLHKQQANEANIPFQEELHDVECACSNPEDLYIRQIEQEKLIAALNSLSLEFREIIVLRELEELSYKEISTIVQIPIGTVMSRLARARKQFQYFIAEQTNKEE